jgi:hypothetical protein
MPRYHFDLVDSKTVADEGGAEVNDDIQAMDVAEQIARRLLEERPELKNRHFSILVSNENGEEVCRVPLDIVQWFSALNAKRVVHMGKLKDKVIGKTKQVVAELTGDGKLAREGKEEVKKGENEQAPKPFGNLDKLT